MYRNLRQLRSRSRVRAKLGDLFVMQIDSTGECVFGRVVRTDASPLGVGGALLLYIYKDTSKDKHDVPHLSVDRLLIPPVMTNNLAWSRGYFETIDNKPLGAGDVLDVHCFYDVSRRHYLDEYRDPLPGLPNPAYVAGVFGLADLSVITELVLNALAVR